MGGIYYEKLGITSGIVLSGAVLFGGIGTSQAHAESYSSVDASNAENIAKEVAKDNGMDPSKQNFFEPKVAAIIIKLKLVINLT